MKRFFLIILIGFLFLFPSHAYADDGRSGNNNLKGSQVESLDTRDLESFIDKLNGETSGYMPPLDFKNFVNMFGSGKENYGIDDILMGIVRFFLNDVILNTKLLGELVVLTIICAILQNLEKAFDNDTVSSLAYYACYLVLVIIVVKSFTIAVGIGRDTINSMVDFMIALLPVLLTLLASVGGFASASVFDPIIMAVVHVVSTIIRDFILSAIFLTAILSIVNNLSDTFKVSKLAGLIRQISVWVLGITMTIFIGIISIRGATAQTLDQVAVKTAKYAVDNFIPIIGKCLSDAVGTIAGYSLVLKDAISTIGLIALVITCIFPILKIVSMIFIYKIACALIEPVSDKRVVNCLNDVGNSLLLVFASVICVAVMFFIMVTIIASTGKMAVMAQ